MSSASTAKANRLIHEKSPYLLQHAHNPVDWYPWGPEAFAAAKKEDKPILVSIGYSTCHWCHVMERESYEDPATAALMNQYLINIKVDREERPDVDKIYMTAVSAMTGQGGWPLNMFLTPDLKPIFGGTYFPPESKWGQPAWKDVVGQIGESWRRPEDRKKMLEAANTIADSLKKYTEAAYDPAKGTSEWLDEGVKAFKASYDSARGGFGGAPKFPMPVYHNFLLRYYARNRTPHPSPLPKGEGAAKTGEAKLVLEMSLHTLRAMAKGGIYDHLGGGFARYSTDENWHVPHFEKMLYDNAQLAVNYLEAYQITRDPELKRTAEETLAYIQRDMTYPDGGFYSAEDADSLATSDAKEKKEGAFYVWEKKEINGLVGDKAGELFAYRYGVAEDGNAKHDPHGEFVGKNILFIAHSISETAKHVELSEEDTFKILVDAKATLFDARKKRPRPHLDDKIVSAWNGMMISAFAKAYQVLGDKAYLDSAEKAARFLKAKLYDEKTHTLYRRWREGDRKGLGIADDYEFVVQGLIDLYEADFNHEWLAWALELTEEANKRFYDSAKGGFFMTALDQDKNLILRVKEDSDNVEPSASSVAVLNLLRLSQHTDRKDLEDIAQKTLQFFGRHLSEAPRALPQMLAALDFALTEPRQVVIAGKPGAPDTEAMLKVLHNHFIPVMTLALSGPDSPYKPLQGKATGYVCFRHICKEPTADNSVFETLLKSL